MGGLGDGDTGIEPHSASGWNLWEKGVTFHKESTPEEKRPLLREKRFKKPNKQTKKPNYRTGVRVLYFYILWLRLAEQHAIMQTLTFGKKKCKNLQLLFLSVQETKVTNWTQLKVNPCELVGQKTENGKISQRMVVLYYFLKTNVLYSCNFKYDHEQKLISDSEIQVQLQSTWKEQVRMLAFCFHKSCPTTKKPNQTKKQDRVKWVDTFASMADIYQR